MRPPPWLLLGLATALLGGCAGYRLGPTDGRPPGARSVLVQPFANQTDEPRLGQALTAALRHELQRDGTFRLARRDSADVVLDGVITRYFRHELSFVPDDVVTVRDYRVTLTAQVTARERAGGRVLFDRPVTGEILLRVGADLASAERQALPLLATDLARKVTGLLADGAW